MERPSLPEVDSYRPVATAAAVRCSSTLSHPTTRWERGPYQESAHPYRRSRPKAARWPILAALLLRSRPSVRSRQIPPPPPPPPPASISTRRSGRTLGTTLGAAGLAPAGGRAGRCKGGPVAARPPAGGRSRPGRAGSDLGGCSPAAESGVDCRVVASIWGEEGDLEECG